MLVVGGGYIAVEFAGIFNGLGVETTLMYRGPLFLRGFDRDVREHLAGEMAKAGIALAVKRVAPQASDTSAGEVIAGRVTVKKEGA